VSTSGKPRTRRSPVLLGCLVVAGVFLVSGLFGTVIGLVKAFGAVGSESIDPSQKARILAEGISEAMNCPAFGLIVGFGVGVPILVGWLVTWRREKPGEDQDGEGGSGKGEPPEA